jgi:hypothetical protein
MCSLNRRPDGPLVFAHACKLGLEGILSPRLNLQESSRDESVGRSSEGVPYARS